MIKGNFKFVLDKENIITPGKPATLLWGRIERLSENSHSVKYWINSKRKGKPVISQIIRDKK